MLDGLDGGWIAVLVIGAIVLFNLGLIYGLLSGSVQQQIDMLRRAASQARHPWAREDEALDALHQRAERLRGSPPADDD